MGNRSGLVCETCSRIDQTDHLSRVLHSSANTNEGINMNFSMICSNEYLPYLYTLLCSIRKNVSDDINIYVITQNISSDNEISLLEYGKKNQMNIKLVRVNDDYLNRYTYYNPNVLGRYPRTLFCNLTLNDLIPDSIDRVLSMEVDTIVDGDISDFYNLHFGENVVAGAVWGIPSNQYVPNCSSYCTKDDCFIDAEKVRDHHVNMGAVLFNLERMRELKVTPEYYCKFQNCFNPEQFLGAAFGDKMLFTNPLRFNYRTSWADTYAKMKLPGDTVIIHYVNRSIYAIYKKPWQILFPDGDLHYISRGCPKEQMFNEIIHKSFKIWWNYAKLSPYYEELYSSMKRELDIYRVKVDSLLKISEEYIRDLKVEIIDLQIVNKNYQNALNTCLETITKDSRIFARMFFLFKEYNLAVPKEYDLDVIFKRSDGNYFAKIGKNSPELSLESSLRWMNNALTKNINWIADTFFGKLMTCKQIELVEKYSSIIEKYAILNNKDAIYLSGEIALHNPGLIKNKSVIAERLYALSQDERYRTLRLADILLKINTPESKRMRLELLKTFAEGNIGGDKTLVLISRAYRDGIGTPKDLVESAKWMKKPAENNYEWSVNEYFDILWKINSEETDIEMIELAKANADIGNVGSMRRLGQAYREGRGVEKDLDIAISWYKKKSDIEGPYLEYAESLLERNRDEDLKTVFEMVTGDNQPLTSIFDRGYVIAENELTDFKSWESETLSYNSKNLFIYHDVSLPYAVCKEGDMAVFVLGHVFDLEAKTSDADNILKLLIKKLSSTERELLDYTDNLAGSFILGYTVQSGNEYELFIIPDALSTQQIFYHTKKKCVSCYDTIIRYLHSEPHSEGYELWLSDGRRKWALPGHQSTYDNIFNLPPNHRLNFEKCTVERFWPCSPVVSVNLDEYTELAKKMLLDEVDLLVSMGKPIIQLTGGRDSRISFAAFDKHVDQVIPLTYVKAKDDIRAHNDSIIASKICSELGVEHEKVELINDERARIRGRLKNVSVGRLTGLSMHNKFPDITLLVSSRSIEIVRKPRFWENMDVFIDNKIKLSDLLTCSNWDDYPQAGKIFKQYCKIMQFDVKYLFNYNPQTIFYWEYRMARWSNATITFDENQYFDTYLLFNCRKLLGLAQGLPNECYHDDLLTNNLINKLMPRISKIPFGDYND